MNWLIAMALLALFGLAWLLLRRPAPLKTDQTPPLTAEELAEAGIELYEISRRLDVALTRHELRTEVLQVRRELDQELRLLKTLDSQDETDE